MSVLVDNFTGITFSEETLNARNDGYIQNSSDLSIGILEGVYDEIDYGMSNLTIDIYRGILKVQGRFIENINSQIILEQPSIGIKFGYVIVKINLGLAPLNQISLELKEDNSGYPVLQQDDFKLKPDDGIYEYAILSYELSETHILSIIDLRNIITDGNSQIKTSNNFTIPKGVTTLQLLNDYADNYEGTVYNYVGRGLQDYENLNRIISNITKPSIINLSGVLVLDQKLLINKDNIRIIGGNLINSSFSSEMIEVTSKNVNIEDVLIDQKTATDNYYAINYSGTATGKIDNVTINAKSNGIIRGVDTNVDITNTKIILENVTSGRTCIYSYSTSRDTISDCKFYNDASNMYHVRFANAVKTKNIENCHFEAGDGSTGIHRAIRVDNTSQIEVINCTFDMSSSGGNYCVSVYNNSVANVYNTNMFMSGSGTHYGVYYSNLGRGNVSSTNINYITSYSATRGILYDASTSASMGKNIISNNYINRSQVGLGGIQIDRVNSNVIGNICPVYDISGTGTISTGNVTS